MAAPAPSTSPERIALVHPGALGDLVQALPALGAVRAAFPSAELTLVTGDDLGALAREFALFERVLTFDARAIYRGGASARLRAFGALALALRRVQPDRVGVFKGATAWAALAAASGASVRVGLTRGRAGAALLSAPIPLDGHTHHEARYAAVARALGADPARRAGAHWDDRVPGALAAALADSGGPFVAIAPGGARNAKQDTDRKRWPAARWAAVARALLSEAPGTRIVLLGAPSDRAEADVVAASLLPGAAVDLVGRTTIPQARAAMARCALVLCSDSGLLHLAATTSTPVVAVFGPTDPRILCPRRAGVTALWEPTGGEPCQDARTGALAARCVPPCCLERVDVAAVVSAARALLSPPESPGPLRSVGAVTPARPADADRRTL